MFLIFSSLLLQHQYWHRHQQLIWWIKCHYYRLWRRLWEQQRNFFGGKSQQARATVVGSFITVYYHKVKFSSNNTLNKWQQPNFCLPPFGLCPINKKKMYKLKETRLAVSIINHYMLMSFHTQRSVCVFAYLNICSCRHVYKCVQKCMRVCVCMQTYAYICVPQKIEGTALLLCDEDQTRPSLEIFMLILPACWKAFPLHFCNKY